MGACGCGDFSPTYKIEGPDGSVYAIELYRPCHYCDTPGGVVLTHLSVQDAERWDMESTPAPEWNDMREIALPMFHPAFIAEQIGTYLSSGTEQESQLLTGDDLAFMVKDSMTDLVRFHNWLPTEGPRAMPLPAQVHAERSPDQQAAIHLAAAVAQLEAARAALDETNPNEQMTAALEVGRRALARATDLVEPQ